MKRNAITASGRQALLLSLVVVVIVCVIGIMP